MYAPSKILAWMGANVEGMRLSRCKPLAAIVSAALFVKGVGVLALGRAMAGEVPPNIALNGSGVCFVTNNLKPNHCSRRCSAFCVPPRAGRSS